jgi:hypothetical protein
VARRALAQRDVEQHDVEGLVGGRLQRRLAVAHRRDAMALALEGAAQHVAQRAVVVDEQDLQRLYGLHPSQTTRAPASIKAC